MVLFVGGWGRERDREQGSLVVQHWSLGSSNLQPNTVSEDTAYTPYNPELQS